MLGIFKYGIIYRTYDFIKSYISYIEDSPTISAYTITNGTVDLEDREWEFLEDHHINV